MNFGDGYVHFLQNDYFKWGINEPEKGSYEAYNFIQAKENFKKQIKAKMESQKASLSANKTEIKEFINMYNILLQNETGKASDDNATVEAIAKNSQDIIMDKYIREVDKEFVETTKGGKLVLDRGAANQANKYRQEIRRAMNSDEFKKIYKNYSIDVDKKPETIINMTKFLYESIKKVSDAKGGLTGLGIQSAIDRIEEFMTTIDSLVKSETQKIKKDGHVTKNLEDAIIDKVNSLHKVRGNISSKDNFVKLINDVYLLLKYSAVSNAQGAYGELTAEIAKKIFNFDIANLSNAAQNKIIDVCKLIAKNWMKNNNKTGTISTSLEFSSKNINQKGYSDKDINEIFGEINNDIVKISAGSQKIDFELKSSDFRASIKNYTLSKEHPNRINIVDDTTLGVLLTDISQEVGWDFAYHLYNLMAKANYAEKNYKFKDVKENKEKGNSIQRIELLNCLSAVKMYFLLDALSGPQNALNRNSANYVILNDASDRSKVRVFSIYEIVDFLLQGDSFLNNVLFSAYLGGSPLNGKLLKQNDMAENDWIKGEGERVDLARQRSAEVIAKVHSKKMTACINSSVFNHINAIDL